MKATSKRAGVGLSLILVLAALVLLSVGGSPLRPLRRELPPGLSIIVQANSAFALDLCSRLSTSSANQIVSPFSASAVLAMAYGGARGTTAGQIATTLHLPTNQPDLHAGMAAILSSFTNLNRAEVELSVRNGVWAQDGSRIAPGFIDLCRKSYGADLDLVDFKASAQSARQRINSWVDHSTKGKMRDFLAPGMVTPDTRLVLANAVYFKGQWASRFDKRKTRNKPFWVTPDRAVQVPTMSQKSIFLYSTDTNAEVLELPYRGGGVSMLLLLPKTRDGMAQLEVTLTPSNLVRWLERLQPADVDLLLPKFKINSRFSLGHTLNTMGMRDAFDASLADFTGITAQRPLSITLFEHGAMIEVDEEGTVAAAASGGGMGCSSKPPPATFYADHPFIFLILDRSMRTLLFVGKVSNPAA